MSRFAELTPQQSFVELEKEILRYWDSNQIFSKTLQNSPNSPKPIFSFFDGPPFATGLPHYGHILAGVIKDAICRFKTMQGFIVPRRFGWDCHGLPVEMEVQKSLNLPTCADIQAFGIHQFNQECKNIVDTYTSDWKSVISKTGRWINMDTPYRTMDAPFMESIWWCFSQLFKKNLIYEGFKILPYSWKAGTSLSNFEANLNYKTVQDPSVIIEFPLLKQTNTSFLAWTTTPWTLPSNMALCVHPKEIYVCVLDSQRNKQFILAKNCLQKIFSSQTNSFPSIQKSFSGEDLVNTPYIPLFNFVSKNGFVHHIVSDNYVSTENGTGIVHQAPAHGEDDYRVSVANQIPYVDFINESGSFINDLGDLSGLFFQDANKIVLKHIKNIKRLFSQSTIQHSYPHCWRTDSPLIYKGMSTWFVRVESLKNDLIKNNQLINWVPHHIKEGRFGKWLQDAKDWDIGRNRFWGTPIPIWKSHQNDLLCIDSIQELQNLSRKSVSDLHRHHIDHISIQKNGVTYTRVHQVLDCWFESGAMPYAQIHYPFENQSLNKSQFPADFIAEGLDQTRGWFYTLLVLSTALQNKPPVKNIVVTGLILAEDGQKMSKRLKNYSEPSIILNSHGADALRLYLFNSSVVRGESLKFSPDAVQDTLRNSILPLWNALYFFTTYANLDNVPLHIDNYYISHPHNWMDSWIVSVCELFVKDMSRDLEAYDLQKSAALFTSFLDKLTNWYIRLNRRRFWKDLVDDDKNSAYACLHHVLRTTALVMAPLIPFLSEKMFHVLQQSDKESVHTQPFPIFQLRQVDQNIVDVMECLEVIVKMGRSLRSSAKIKNRQPLPLATIICTNTQKCPNFDLIQPILLDELNLKKIYFSTDPIHCIPVSYSALPNLPLLGKSWGKYLPEIKEKISLLSQTQLISLKNRETFSTTLLDGTPFIFSCENVLIKHSLNSENQSACAESFGDITLHLDTSITEELFIECVAREIINRIQKYRKQLDLPFEQQITFQLSSHSLWEQAFIAHETFILQETLAQNASFIKGLDKTLPVQIEGLSGFLHIEIFS